MAEPEFTDTARAALLWVLWHHQGGNSKVGQPIRFALGKDAHEPLSDWEVEQAKRWGAADFRTFEPGVAVGADWLPTTENINALPEPLRLYIAGLETLCDPAGIVRENTLLKDCNKGLQAMYRKAADAGVGIPQTEQPK